MPKSRSPEAKPLLRKATADPKAKLSSRQVQSAQPQLKSTSGKNNKKESVKTEVVHLHQNVEQPPYLARPIPWWVFPQERGLFGGLFGGGPGGPGGPGILPPGPGPFPPGPGPGPFPPGPGPFPPGPGPGPFPPGPGPFPPPPFPGPFPPGPGPFPPPPFPGPGPFPIPIPIPIPIPGPHPFPPHQAFITVRITGGVSFPRVNYTNYIPFYPGITIRRALESTGLVGFGPAGFIRNVAGIPISGAIEVRLRYNGRVIPQTILNAPAEPGSIIGLELHHSITGAIPIPL